MACRYTVRMSVVITRVTTCSAARVACRYNVRQSLCCYYKTVTLVSELRPVWPADTMSLSCGPCRQADQSLCCYYKTETLVSDGLRRSLCCYYKTETLVSELRPMWPADTMSSVALLLLQRRLRLVSELRPVWPADTMSVSRSVVITRL